MWMTTLRIMGSIVRVRAPVVCRPMVRVRRGRPAGTSGWVVSGNVLERVVEVDDEADAAARDPDADAHPVVGAVHQVHVVAAVVGLLALEVEVRAEDRRVRVARS